jgi:hypothetical protein
MEAVSKDLSVIREELSIEEEEKTPATSTSKMKKAKKSIVMSSNDELKNAFTTPNLPKS